jgi:hypothetical protein
LRPGGLLENRPGAPVFLVPGARHCNDLILKNGDANPDMKQAIYGEVAQIKSWIAEFYGTKSKRGERKRSGVRDGEFQLAVEPWDHS